MAIVSRNVLSCLLNVPAAGPRAYKCFRSHASRPVSGPDYPPLAVFCMDCGYCLNFGKQTGVGGRLNSFRPTLQFYPRDQKEKHVLTCHASGRVYCSNCGSAAVGCQRLAEPPSARSGWRPRIRAVLPHNAAYELDRGSRLLDAIIPAWDPTALACGRWSCGGDGQAAPVFNFADRGQSRLLHLSATPSSRGRPRRASPVLLLFRGRIATW